MKHIILFLIIFILCTLIFGESNTSNYIFNVKLDIQNHTIYGYEDIEYINYSNDTLYKVNIHLYANYFEENSDFYKNGNNKKNEYGYTKIDSIFENNVKNFNLKINNTIAYLTLNKPLIPDDTVKLRIYFINKIPYPYLREGVIDEKYDVSQWYPKIAVYTKERWADFQAKENAEFFGEYGNYTLNIEVPDNYFVFGTGKIIYPEDEYDILNSLMENDTIITVASKGEFRDITLYAENVHDMAFVVRKEFSFIRETKDLLNINIVCSPKNYNTYKEKINDIFGMFDFYSNKYIKYPYNDFTIAEGILQAGAGMEYPQFIIIADTDYKRINSIPFIKMKFFDTVLCHEIGHQWFYLLIGSNEAIEPFIDEGFTTYSEHSYMKHKFINKTFIDLFNRPFLSGFDISYLSFLFLQRTKGSAPINYSSYDYTSLRYGLNVYQKGYLIICAIEDMIGKDIFANILKKFFTEYKFSHPDIADLFNLLNNETENKFYYELKNLLYENVYTDYYIEKIETNDNYVIIKIGNNSYFDFPVPILIEYTDGETEIRKKEIDNNEIKFYASKNIEKIIIDPEMKYLDINYHNNSSKLNMNLHLTNFSPDYFNNNLYLYPSINYSLFNKTSYGLTLYICDLPVIDQIILGNYTITAFLGYNHRTNAPLYNLKILNFQGMETLTQFKEDIFFTKEYISSLSEISAFYNKPYDKDYYFNYALKFYFRNIINNSNFVNTTIYADTLTYIGFDVQYFRMLNQKSGIRINLSTEFSDPIIYSSTNYKKISNFSELFYKLNNIKMGIQYRGAIIFNDLNIENALYLNSSPLRLFNTYENDYVSLNYINNGFEYFTSNNAMFSQIHKLEIYAGNIIKLYFDIYFTKQNNFFQTGLYIDIKKIMKINIPIYNSEKEFIWENGVAISISSEIINQLGD